MLEDKDLVVRRILEVFVCSIEEKGGVSLVLVTKMDIGAPMIIGIRREGVVVWRRHVDLVRMKGGVLL